MFSVQCAVCSLLCAVCSVKCEVYSVQCAVCILQCEMCSVKCVVCSVQCAVHSAWGPYINDNRWSQSGHNGGTNLRERSHPGHTGARAVG